MYQICCSQESYSDPWLSSFEQRMMGLAKGHKRIAYFYDYPDSSTFRYRVYNMIQALHDFQDEYSAAFFSVDEIDKLDRIIDISDILIICRSKYTNKLNRLITRAKNKGKTVFFDVDDLVFEPGYVQLILDTLDQDLNHPNVWDFWFAYIGRIRATLDLCDSVITTNNYLAQKIGLYTKKPVSVIPNFLNREQMEISVKIYDEKRRNGFLRDNTIHIGYFSGTPSHNKDLELASDALVHLLKKDPRIIIRIVGYMEIKGELKNFQNRIERLPLYDFVNLQRVIGEVEVNIIPLQDNEFTNCKSELKFFEAGIVGTTSMSSPIYTFSTAIQDGKNGFLAKSFEWYDKLFSLINHIDHLGEINENAFFDCKKNYSWQNQIELIKKTLFTEIS